MSRCFQLTALLLALTYLLPVTLAAEIYKCVAENGDLTFSQAPCPEKSSKVTVMTSGGSSSGEAADCEHARRFALNTAQQMRSGTESSTIFDSYGGLGALSKGSVSLISYVYQFRTNEDASAVRVSALATAKCQARAFGDVGCEQLPGSFIDRLGGCDIGDEESRSIVVDDVELMGAEAAQLHGSGSQPINSSLQETNATLRARNQKAKAAEEEKRLECRDRIDSQIDTIDEQFRSGYTIKQGESLKNRRRGLETKKRGC